MWSSEGILCGVDAGLILSIQFVALSRVPQSLHEDGQNEPSPFLKKESNSKFYE